MRNATRKIGIGIQRAAAFGMLVSFTYGVAHYAGGILARRARRHPHLPGHLCLGHLHGKPERPREVI